MDLRPITTIIVLAAFFVAATGLPYPDAPESRYVALAAVQAAEPDGDSTVAPDNDQTGAEPETERESEIGNAGAVTSEVATELEELSDDTSGASDAESDKRFIVLLLQLAGKNSICKLTVNDFLAMTSVESTCANYRFVGTYSLRRRHSARIGDQ